MRHRLHIALFLYAVMVSLAAAQPQTTWLEQKCDLGVFMEKDGKVSCQMRVVNTGNEPLLVVKAQAGCGCTSINYPEEPILPGDTAAVSITYNPSGRPGQFTKQAIIFTNTVEKRTILEITGNVIPTDKTLDEQYPISAGSLRITQQNMPFGELTRGKGKTEFLSAYNASTDTLIVHVDGAKPHINPSVVPDTVPPARVTALTVHYISGQAPLWGLNVDTLTLTVEPLRQPSQATAGSANIHVMAQVLEDFSRLSGKELDEAPVVSVDCGDRLDFGSVKAGDKCTRTFTVTNKGKNMLSIRRLWHPEGEGVTATIDRQEIKRGKKATATVTVDTSKLDDKLLNVPLTLISNDPVTPSLNIRLVGFIDKQ